MTSTRSGMCLTEDKPSMHRLCSGTFTANAGEMEHSVEADCTCDCHKPDTALHRKVRRGPG